MGVAHILLNKFGIMASNNPESQNDHIMMTSESDHHEPGRASNDEESEDFSVGTEELIENLMPGAWAEDDEDDEEDEGM